MRNWIAVFVAVAAAGAAVAADQAAPAGPGWDRAQMEQVRAARQARRADDVALLLGLRPEQRPAFDRFMQAMRPPHGGPGGMRDMAARHRADEDAPLSARLDAMQARVDRHDVMAKERIASTRMFYASLSPDQQRRFDALDRLRRDRMHGHHGGMGGRMMGWRGMQPAASAGD